METVGIATVGVLVVSSVLLPTVGWLLAARWKGLDAKLDGIARKLDGVVESLTSLRTDHEVLKRAFEDHVGDRRK